MSKLLFGMHFCFASVLNNLFLCVLAYWDAFLLCFDLKQPVSLCACQHIFPGGKNVYKVSVPVFTVLASWKHSCFQVGEKARGTLLLPSRPQVV